MLRAYRKRDFPKGGVEAGESPLEAAIRETAEEADLRDLVFRWARPIARPRPMVVARSPVTTLRKLRGKPSRCPYRPNSGGRSTTRGAGWAPPRPNACCRRGCSRFSRGRGGNQGPDRSPRSAGGVFDAGETTPSRLAQGHALGVHAYGARRPNRSAAVRMMTPVSNGNQ
ncbi:MAG: NUDIX domain-containing protein [Thiobacillus sp.]